MTEAKCVNKLRDNNNKIVGYTIQDLNGNIRNMEACQLKQLIRSGNIHVVNLKLTSDGRLIDSNIEQLNTNIKGSAISVNSINKNVVEAYKFLILNTLLSDDTLQSKAEFVSREMCRYSGIDFEKLTQEELNELITNSCEYQLYNDPSQVGVVIDRISSIGSTDSEKIENIIRDPKNLERKKYITALKIIQQYVNNNNYIFEDTKKYLDQYMDYLSKKQR